MNTSAGDLQRPSPWRNVGAIALGVLVVIVASIATDEVLQKLAILPPPEQGLHDPALNALALAYRCVYNVLGALATAWVAPGAARRNLVIFALIGLALGTTGAVVMIPMHLGPAWYPILLALSALPCTWIGWRLSSARARAP